MNESVRTDAVGNGRLWRKSRLSDRVTYSERTKLVIEVVLSFLLRYSIEEKRENWISLISTTAKLRRSKIVSVSKGRSWVGI